MSILSILLGFKKCSHDNMPLDVKCGYCPTCGEYVENRWYLVRCSCCGVKRVAVTKGSEVVPKSRFCKNCGEEEYYVEELSGINFFDIDYATVMRVCPENNRKSFTQAWVQEETAPMKLLGHACC